MFHYTNTKILFLLNASFKQITFMEQSSVEEYLT